MIGDLCVESGGFIVIVKAKAKHSALETKVCHFKKTRLATIIRTLPGKV
jgi:hypothetical protein